MEFHMRGWLVIDGYVDEPAAFGVPNYLGFHIRYICGVLESRGIPYTYMTIDQWRIKNKHKLSNQDTRLELKRDLSNLGGAVVLAGAIVPGKYARGTPISRRELDQFLSIFPKEQPVLCGGWAIRHWRYDGWIPLRSNLFCTVQDTDATLDNYLSTNVWANKKRTVDQWKLWANKGASSKAVTDHPDLFTDDGRHGPLTYEVELYQGCVRFKRGCKFCIEPKKGVPIWREERDILDEVNLAIDKGVRNVRLGGATDIYTYKAEGVLDLEYPIPNPEPISELLFGLRGNENLEILHVDNGNPSIIAENIGPSSEITKSMVNTLSDGAVLSFGLESADPLVHNANWLNCNPSQLIKAISHINDFGRERGPRGLPKLLPGLNFIAGLNGESESSYQMNLDLLSDIRKKGLLLRRINIRQVEGQGFQEIPQKIFQEFKETVRNTIDKPLLEELFPLGTILKNVWWESHDNRIRDPKQVTNIEHRDIKILGKAGITFGRQIGAYPILIGVPYLIPLETQSDILITGHGMRSISGIETGLNINKITQNQLSAIPGLGRKGAWKIVSKRANKLRKDNEKFTSIYDAFKSAEVNMPEFAEKIFVVE
jgi:radical SAM superfamily enzyme with C-terminal helix-hairpin-helix motif